eukprot:3164828-Prymnesium_polylepis.1
MSTTYDVRLPFGGPDGCGHLQLALEADVEAVGFVARLHQKLVGRRALEQHARREQQAVGLLEGEEETRGAP